MTSYSNKNNNANGNIPVGERATGRGPHEVQGVAAMDYDKLKGRPPFPFETIGVAIAFSPFLEKILAEAKLLAETFRARLVLIHIGEHHPHRERMLTEILERLGLTSAEVTLIWQDGDPVKKLLHICKENLVDLLVLGARRREMVLRYYLGSVARRMSRRAKCSLLLLCEPTVEGTTFRRLVVTGVVNPKTLLTINTAIYFAQHLGGREITVVTESDQAGLAMAMAYDNTAAQSSLAKNQFTSEETTQSHAMVCLCSPGELKVSEEIVLGRPGFAIRQYADSSQADLLVINSPDAEYGLLDRIFPHDIEYILEDLPCNLLIVHSRLS